MDSSPDDTTGIALVTALLRARRDKWPPGTALRGGRCFIEGDAALDVSGVTIGVVSLEVESMPKCLSVTTQNISYMNMSIM